MGGMGWDGRDSWDDMGWDGMGTEGMRWDGNGIVYNETGCESVAVLVHLLLHAEKTMLEIPGRSELSSLRDFSVTTL